MIGWVGRCVTAVPPGHVEAFYVCGCWTGASETNDRGEVLWSEQGGWD
jgi:hypothetical protein